MMMMMMMMMMMITFLMSQFRLAEDEPPSNWGHIP